MILQPGETELIERRTPQSKIIHISGNKYRFHTGLGAPIHYLKNGKYEDIVLAGRTQGPEFIVDQAPYTLRVKRNSPAHVYTSQAGEVSVTLEQIDGTPLKTIPTKQREDDYVWDVATSTEYIVRPLPFGTSTLLVLKDDTAPKSWTWQIIGSKELLRPITGKDAKGQICELQIVENGDTVTVTWTGRVYNQAVMRLDPDKAWGTVVWPVVIDPSVNETISTGTDDGYTSYYSGFGTGTNQVLNGTCFLGHNTAFYGFIDQYGYVGFRFQTIAIPQGSTITSAAITVYCRSLSGTTNATCWADDVDDAPTWSGSSKIVNITKTTASASVAITTTGYKSFGVTSIVQELIDRTGWTSSNDMRFVLWKTGAETDYCHLESLEQGSGHKATLDIVYTAGSGPYVTGFIIG